MIKKILLSLFLLCVGVFGAATSVSAGDEHSLNGWAWSDNIGWISFNSNDCEPSIAGCPPVPTADYGVNMDTDGVLSGYAWSDNIGWIKFGGLSDFPVGSGTSAVNARLEGASFSGWARALSGVGRVDGWDGWISLKGTSGDGAAYGLVLDGDSVKSFAWGSDVVGWVLFNPFDSGAVPTPPGGCPPEGCCTGVCHTTRSFVVDISANPYTGNAPLQSELTAVIVSGSDEGAEYQFDCDVTGDNPVYGDLQIDPTYICSYDVAGSYTVAVRAKNGSRSDEDQTGITVLAADPLALSCAAPGGTTLSVGESKTFYQKARVSSSDPNGCVSELRTCQVSEGGGAILSGSYQYPSCSISPIFEPI